MMARSNEQIVLGSRIRAAVNLGFQNADWNDITSIIISAVFLVLAIWRLLVLRKESIKTRPYSTDTTKLTLTFGLLVTTLADMVLCIRNFNGIQDFNALAHTSNSLSLVTLLDSIIKVPVSLVIIILSLTEHHRSIRPSALLELYFLLSVPPDILSTKYQDLFTTKKANNIASIVSTIADLAPLLAEARSKVAVLLPEYQAMSPEALSGFINRCIFWWLQPLFVLGSSRLLGMRDLYPLDEKLGEGKLGVDLKEKWGYSLKRPGRCTFILACARSLGWQYAAVILPRLLLVVFTYAQPFLITEVLTHVERPLSERKWDSSELVAATGIVYLGIAFSSVHANHNLYGFIASFRTATVSLIYDRALMLDENTYDDAAAVTLMSTDVDRISYCLEELNECWSRPIEICIGIPLLARQLGWVSLVPLLVIGYEYFHKLSRRVKLIEPSIVMIGDKQRNWADATQKPMSMTSSVLSQMKGVKMMGLETTLAASLQERIKETKLVEKWSWVKVWMTVIANAPMVFCPAATFAVYAIDARLRGHASLDTTKAFTSLALIMLVSQPVSRLLCAIPNAASSIGCFDRIQEYLLSRSFSDTRTLLQRTENVEVGNGRFCDTDSQLSFEALTHEELDEAMIVMKDITIRLGDSPMSILENINVQFQKGKLAIIAGPIASGKSPLLKALLGELQPSTGEITMRSKIIAYCSQIPWLPNNTIHDIICEPSTNDTDGERYRTVIGACALYNDLLAMPDGDQSLAGTRGSALSGGQKARVALARAIYARADILLLDDVLSGLDGNTKGLVVERLFGKEGLCRKLGMTVVLVTHAVEYLLLADHIVLLGGDKSLHQGTYEELKASGLLASGVEEGNGHLNQAEEEEQCTARQLIETPPPKSTISDEAQDASRATGDWVIYGYYLKSIGKRNMLIFIFFCLLNVFSSSFSHIWLSWWTLINGHQIALYISVYFLLASLYTIGIGGYVWAISVLIGPSTGRKLHQVLVNTVMAAPLSLFTRTEVGSILNRFSQDMMLIEGPLAYGVLATVTNFLSALAQAGLVATGSLDMVPTIPFFILVIYFVQHVYLRISRQLRYLELETRSPLYSHFFETLEGLSTIRAFGWERKWTKECLKGLDTSQRPYYLLFCTQRWLALCLDLITGGMAFSLVIVATSLNGATSAGLLGVSMNNIIAFNISVGAFVRGWTNLETSLGAIARLKTFESRTEKEAREGEDFEPPYGWPFRGHVHFRDVSASYNSTASALQNVTMTIKPGQKLGICGRTGSGKTTLISTLLRLLNLTSGQILIDHLEISTITPSSLRQQLTIIPQDPLYLPGTLRLNIDPFHTSTDIQIITTLTKVGLWDTLSIRGGLDAEFPPSSLSFRQMQLLALARALLRKSKLVVLDEVSSNLDVETARKVGKVIEEEFEGCTVLMIAHRWESLKGCDVVAVLSEGRVVEFGAPGDLMRLEGSEMRKLWGVSVDIS